MASNQLNEQEIQFKKRARRRLVGAIALVLLMVTILPMVLDDRAAKQPQQEIAITIPSQDNKDFTSKVVPVPEEAALPEEAPPSETGANKPAEVPPPENPSKSTEIPPLTESANNTPTSMPKTDTKVESPTKAKVESKILEPAPAKEVTQAKEATQAPAGAASVQIGVFSDSNNVKQLQQKLQSLGYKSYTEKVATSKGEKIRLRAGPFSSRAEADSALAKIKGAGMTGMVVSK
jgi:DedD protein